MSALDDHECEAAATVLGAQEPDRKTFLGGSDAAAVGLSPYATPV